MRTQTSKTIAACLAAAIATTTTGCATSAKNVGTAYVSPIQYQAYTCPQIGLEVQRLAFRVSEMTGKVDDKATRDAVAMGVGLVLFWPALFFLSGGNAAEQAELARLKGEYEALQQAAIARNCQFAAAPEATAPVLQSTQLN